MYDEYKNHDIAVYGGYISDDRKLLESTSGGIATALAEHVIKHGGYVAGVVYSDDLYRAEYYITNSLDDIEKFKGSKYIECEKGTIFRDVKALLEKGHTVLFFGLPCIVCAMGKFCHEFRDKLILCELICHGPTKSEVHKQYIEYLERKYNSKVVSFCVRRKKGQWMPPYLYAEFESGDIFQSNFYRTEYATAFNTLGMEACYNCKFKGNNRTGDLMIGDFWGAQPTDSYWNEKGVSVIFAETEKGDCLLKEIETIKLFETDFEIAVKQNPRVISSKMRSPKYEKFWKDLQKYGLFVAVKKSRTPKEKLKWLIKKCLSHVKGKEQ